MCFDALAQSTYVSIESYRKNGRAVPTPVWIVADGDKLFCWTLGNSGKVKRIRAKPQRPLSALRCCGQDQRRLGRRSKGACSNITEAISAQA